MSMLVIRSFAAVCFTACQRVVCLVASLLFLSLDGRQHCTFGNKYDFMSLKYTIVQHLFICVIWVYLGLMLNKDVHEVIYKLLYILLEERLLKRSWDQYAWSNPQCHCSSGILCCFCLSLDHQKMHCRQLGTSLCFNSLCCATGAFWDHNKS